MIRFLLNMVVYFLAALVGIIAADVILPGFTVSGFTSYVVVALIFGVIQGILSPLIGNVVSKNARAFQGGVGIISVLITLVITEAITPDLEVDGPATWILAALIIWLFAAIAAFILPFFIVKRVVDERRD
jgi:uncharacterized membrane protein YvlD (DUF360 family)